MAPRRACKGQSNFFERISGIAILATHAPIDRPDQLFRFYRFFRSEGRSLMFYRVEAENADPTTSFQLILNFRPKNPKSWRNSYQTMMTLLQ